MANLLEPGSQADLIESLLGGTLGVATPPAIRLVESALGSARQPQVPTKDLESFLAGKFSAGKPGAIKKLARALALLKALRPGRTGGKRQKIEALERVMDLMGIRVGGTRTPAWLAAREKQLVESGAVAGASPAGTGQASRFASQEVVPKGDKRGGAASLAALKEIGDKLTKRGGAAGGLLALKELFSKRSMQESRGGRMAEKLPNPRRAQTQPDWKKVAEAVRQLSTKKGFKMAGKDMGGMGLPLLLMSILGGSDPSVLQSSSFMGGGPPGAGAGVAEAGAAAGPGASARRQSMMTAMGLDGPGGGQQQFLMTGRGPTQAAAAAGGLGAGNIPKLGQKGGGGLMSLLKAHPGLAGGGMGVLLGLLLSSLFSETVARPAEFEQQSNLALAAMPEAETAVGQAMAPQQQMQNQMLFQTLMQNMGSGRQQVGNEIAL